MEPDVTEPAVRPYWPCPYWPFLPTFFSLAGWAILYIWLFLMQVNIRVYIVPGALGLLLTVWPVIFSRHGQYCTARGNGGPSWNFRLAAVSQILLLLALGAALGSLVVIGSVALLAVSAALLNFLPWRRLPLSALHPALACLVTGCSCGLTLYAGWQDVAMMFLPLAAWSFWVSALIGLILNADQSRRVERTTLEKRTDTTAKEGASAYSS